MSFTDFERLLLKGILGGDHPVLAALRAQLGDASVEGRETSELGFLTNITVTGDHEPVDDDLEMLDDLQLRLSGAATPAEVVLHLRDGVISALECSVYDGVFPEQPRIEAAWYYGTKEFETISEELIAERDVEGLLEE